MKVNAAVLTLLLSLGAASAQEQVTSAVGSSSRAIGMVASDIADWHNAEHPSCKMKHVVSASIKERDSESSTELWTVEGCDGKTFQYQVMVMLGGGGGFSTMVGNPDGSAFHSD
jgi:hypothetical protein